MLLIHDNKECLYRIDKNNCLALNWKDCTDCKFFKHIMFNTPDIIIQKAEYKKERQEQKAKSRRTETYIPVGGKEKKVR